VIAQRSPHLCGRLTRSRYNLPPAEPDRDDADQLVVVVAIHVVHRGHATVAGPAVELDQHAVLLVPDIGAVSAQRTRLRRAAGRP